MSRHTPGPWSVDRRASTHVIASGDRGICSTGGHHNNQQHPDELADENHANARLIAAAPDLLVALTSLRSVFLLEDALNPGYGWRAHVAAAIDPLLAKIDGDA